MPLDDVLDALIKREGGFSHLAADRGGATKYGITQTTLAAWRQVPVTVEDVQALTPEEAKTIYTALYVERPGFLKLAAPLQEQMIDIGVNSGPRLAIQALQEVTKTPIDGILGPMTVAATIGHEKTVNNALVKWRIMMVARIVRRDPSQLTFLSGWLSRILDFFVN